MRPTRWLAVAAGLSLAGASAVAIATYNTPLKAKTIKTDLVVAYKTCAAPNATMFFSNTPLPACTPPSPVTATNATHVVTFGPKGSMNIAASLGSGDIKVAVKGSDIQDNGMPSNSNLKAAATSVISTVNNCAPGSAAARRRRRLHGPGPVFSLLRRHRRSLRSRKVLAQVEHQHDHRSGRDLHRDARQHPDLGHRHERRRRRHRVHERAPDPVAHPSSERGARCRSPFHRS